MDDDPQASHSDSENMGKDISVDNIRCEKKITFLYEAVNLVTIAYLLIFKLGLKNSADS